MFSPSSYQMEAFNNNFQENQNEQSGNISENDQELMNASNDNLIYGEEECNGNAQNSFGDDSNIPSYCGIKGNSIESAILNICASAVGSGCFTFPWIISTLGVFNSIFIFCVVTVCIYYSLDLLRSFVVDTKNFSFSLMTEVTLGKKWLRVYSISSFFYYLSFNITYICLFYSIYKSFWVSHSSFLGFIFLLVTCSIEIFICVYTSKIKKINLLSLITMFNYFIIVFVTVIEGFHNSIHDKYISKKFSKKYLINPSKDQGGWKVFFASITACTKYIFAYSYHCSFPTLIGNLKNINNTNSKKVHRISFGILAGTYFLLGFFGYLIKDNVSTVLFREYEDSNEKDYFTVAIKVILFIFLFSLIPSRYIVVRDGYTSLIGKEKLTYKIDLLITALSFIFCNVLAFMNEERFVEEGYIKLDIISIMVNIFGGLFGVIIVFGLPVINYAAVNGKRKLKSLIGYGITGLFLVVGLLSFGYSFHEMFMTKDDE